MITKIILSHNFIHNKHITGCPLGHTQGFGKAFPGLLTTCFGDGEDKPFTAKLNKHAEAEILNPMQNYTYDFMKIFFEEVRQVFRDRYVHLGMDEVYYDCWRSNPQVW